MEQLATAAMAGAGDITAALDVARAAGPILADASAATVLAALAALGAADLTVARVVEPHLDARLILGEAGQVPDVGIWGVFAAEAPGLQLAAQRDGEGWVLTGTKPWCSLAGVLDRALVTATTPAGRGLFAVDLHHPGVQVTDVEWVARGLTAVVSSPVQFTAVPADAVGAPGWYLSRPGFAWGGVRVAACWAGGARALVEHLRAALAARPALDPIRLANLGRADVAAWSAGLAVAHAGAEIDAGRAAGAAGELLAARTRAVVADAAETAIQQSGHALGPAPLAFEAEHARRVADLALYVRQHHAERDLAALAGMLT